MELREPEAPGSTGGTPVPRGSDVLPAAILAAGKAGRELTTAAGTEVKALASIGGRAMVDWVLDAVRACPSVGEIRVVCAPASPLVEHVGDLAAPAIGPAYVDSMTTGFEALGWPERVLIITGDLPLLTPEGLDHFCREALQSDASFVYPMIGRDVSERFMPGGRRTYVHLREGAFTGGNLAVVSREFFREQRDRLAAAFAARKNPLRMSAMLGWSFLPRLFLRQLSLAQVVAAAERLLQTRVHVVNSPYPEIGFDVDDASNLAAVRARLTQGVG